MDRDDQRRFDAVENADGYAEALAHEPSVHSWVYVALSAGWLSTSVTFAVVSLALLAGFDVPLAFKLVWLTFTLGFVALGVALVVHAWRFHTAPIARFIGLVIRTRTDVFSSADYGTSSTYYVTLQTRDGNRAEHAATGSLVGQVTAGDIGVAYRKSSTLVAFRRFSV